jgi:aminodeoxyfutalosine deaminase
LKLDHADIKQHPLTQIVRHGIPVVLSTDDPTMFHTSLREEYQHAQEMGLSEADLAGLVANGFDFAFLKPGEQKELAARPA